MNDATQSAQMTSTSTPWRHYPFELVSGDSEFRFPAAEGDHPHYESDTWFIAGELSAAKSGRSFAFLTIFNRNRPGGSVVADFHTVALFDLNAGRYGTYTDYDMPPANMVDGAVAKLTAATGHLDLTYDGAAGTAVWRIRRDADGAPIPYTYDVELAGTDQDGAQMALSLTVTPTRPPVPVGADTYHGRFACLGQQETFSYFQTGLTMTGTLQWGEVDEEVSGVDGHIDRQWFPLPAGGGGSGGDPRAISHEWRTIHLDNGVDFVGWRQFDRQKGNVLKDFSGATVTYSEPGAAPECVEDVEVDTVSYVRWPESVHQLFRPLAAGRYMPDRHTLTSRTLDLELTGEPLVPAPAHGLPIEYMEGPFVFHGTMRGKPVRGFGISERSIALYRDWELIDVLAITADGFGPDCDELIPKIAALRALIAKGQRSEGLRYLETELRPTLDSCSVPAGAELRQIVEDLAPALRDTLDGVVS